MAQVDALELLTPENSRRVSANALPADIWRSVFNLVPATAQTALALVNHTCLEVYHAKRYRALHLEDYSPVTKRLVRLLGDQSVANLAREVYIRPWDISHESRPKEHRLASRFWVRFAGIFSPAEAERLEKERSERRAQRRINLIRAVLSTIPAARYSIDWDEQSPYNIQFFSEMLRPVLKGVMRHPLFYLFLKIPPETILAARLVGLRLPALETLHIELCIPGIYPHAMHYLEDVRLFITNVEFSDHPHLRALEVGVTPTSVPFDLSTFFRHLGPFHALDTFGLSIPFNGAHLRDVTGLRAFLYAHAHQLHHLAFRTRRMTPAAAQSNPGWVLDALRGMCFAHLISAELALRPVAGPFDIDGLGAWLREHAAGLSSIALTDRQLTLDEVVVIVGALDKEIVQDLRLRVRRLSAPLLETVARGLPQLCELEITHISIGSTEEGVSGVAAFLRALNRDRDIYEDWHLKRFRVRQPFTVLDDTSEGRLFRITLPKLVPSFKSARIQVA